MGPGSVFVVKVMVLNPLVDLKQLHPLLLCVVDSFVDQHGVGVLWFSVVRSTRFAS